MIHFLRSKLIVLRDCLLNACRVHVDDCELFYSLFVLYFLVATLRLVFITLNLIKSIFMF
jgi:hypothetical protein